MADHITSNGSGIDKFYQRQRPEQGKGSDRRPGDDKAFRENWDRIFRKVVFHKVVNDDSYAPR